MLTLDSTSMFLSFCAKSLKNSSIQHWLTAALRMFPCCAALKSFSSFWEHLALAFVLVHVFAFNLCLCLSCLSDINWRQQLPFWDLALISDLRAFRFFSPLPPYSKPARADKSFWIFCSSSFSFQHQKWTSSVCPTDPASEGIRWRQERRMGRLGVQKLGERICATLPRLPSVKCGSRPAHKRIKATRQILGQTSGEAAKSQKRAGSCVKLIWTWQKYTATCHLQVSHSF